MCNRHLTASIMSSTALFRALCVKGGTHPKYDTLGYGPGAYLCAPLPEPVPVTGPPCDAAGAHAAAQRERPGGLTSTGATTYDGDEQDAGPVGHAAGHAAQARIEPRAHAGWCRRD